MILANDADDCRDRVCLDNMIARAWKDLNVKFTPPRNSCSSPRRDTTPARSVSPSQNLESCLQNFILPRLIMRQDIVIAYGPHRIKDIEGVSHLEQDQASGLCYVYFDDEDSQQAALQLQLFEECPACTLRRRERIVTIWSLATLVNSDDFKSHGFSCQHTPTTIDAVDCDEEQQIHSGTFTCSVSGLHIGEPYSETDNQCAGSKKFAMLHRFLSTPTISLDRKRLAVAILISRLGSDFSVGRIMHAMHSVRIEEFEGFSACKQGGHASESVLVLCLHGTSRKELLHLDEVFAASDTSS